MVVVAVQPLDLAQTVRFEPDGPQASELLEVLNLVPAFEMKVELVVQPRRRVQVELLASLLQRLLSHVHHPGPERLGSGSFSLLSSPGVFAVIH